MHLSLGYTRVGPPATHPRPLWKSPQGSRGEAPCVPRKLSNANARKGTCIYQQKLCAALNKNLADRTQVYNR